MKRVEEVTRKVLDEMAALQRENEALIVQVLTSEDKDSEWEVQLGLVAEEIKEAEDAIARVEGREQEVDQSIKDREVKRSSLTQQLSKRQRDAHRLKEVLVSNGMMMKDATKGVDEVVRVIRQCGDKYEVLKGQKGTLQGMVTEMEGALAEVMERSKMLDAEMVVLKGEMQEKERHSGELDQQVKEVKAKTEKLRVEENTKRQALKQSSERELELTNEVSQLSEGLKRIEQGMEGMKSQYVHATTSRNTVGMALIDRNDELCLLYEQTEVLTRMLKSYEDAIHQTDEQSVKVVRDTEDIKRRVEIARRQIPSVKTWEEWVRHKDELLMELSEEKKEVDRLSVELETPPNDDGLVSRARLLGGEDADVHVLASEVEGMEERVKEERVRLLDVELRLKESEAVVERMGRDCAEQREGAVIRAMEGVEERAEVRRAERQMQADVSELSMYQAMLVKGQTERQMMEEELTMMRQRLERGECPSKDAEVEWVRRQRERVRLAEALISRKRTKEEEELLATMVKTTAEVRPNAYIQDQLGLPKPYGGLAPFKPSVLGAQMRHFRVPQPREVQL
jgi:hypothetical protein